MESDRIEVLLYSISDQNNTYREIAEAAGVSENTATKYIKEEKDREMINNPGYGKFRATEELSRVLASFRPDFQLRTNQEIIEPENVEPQHDW